MKKPKPDITAKLLEWDDLQVQLQQIKKKEMALRVEIAEELTGDDEIGTHTFRFGEIQIKVKKSYNYKIDRDLLDENEDLFTVGENACIRRNPELNMKEYKALKAIEMSEPEVASGYLDECISVTPSTPTLEIRFILED